VRKKRLIYTKQSLLESIGRPNYSDAPFKNVGFVDQTGGKSINGVLAEICKENRDRSEGRGESTQGYETGNRERKKKGDWMREGAGEDTFELLLKEEACLGRHQRKRVREERES